MPSTRYPILAWRDASGAGTALLVGDFETAAAYGPDPDDALRQLRELLEWRVENEPWNLDPDFLETALEMVDVDARPQYRNRQRLIPCPESVRLRIPCVTGRQASGLRLCAIPHLGVQFNYQEPHELRGLVAHYVHEALHGLTPAEFAERLPPSECRLETLVLKTGGPRVRTVPPDQRPELAVLFAVADPLLQAPGPKRASAVAYGRDALVDALVETLGDERANVLLVGDSGVGKSTVLDAAARRIARRRSGKPGAGASLAGEDPEDTGADGLRNHRFWRTNAGRLVAGMRYLGQWEERCEEVIERLRGIDGVLIVESLLELLSVGGLGPGDSIAAFLVPYLQRGELRLASEATPAEVEACRRLLPGLLDVFRLVPVPAFDDSEAARILDRIATAHAASAKAEIEPGVVPLVQRLFRRFHPYLPLPGPAADFLRSLADTRSPGPRSLGAADVIAAFVRRTGLPEIFLRDDLLLRFDEVRATFAARILGQPDATEAAARLVTTIKAGLNDPQRPLGVLLFCGPTGVGKTALARELAGFCFGAAADDRLVRLDMSEYGGYGAATRLLEDPRGRPAEWIDRVRRQPFAVVLFDEIEKAAPEVFDVLLSLLDEGRLTDRFGRVNWFRGTIIVLTSNLGAGVPTLSGFSADATPGFESEVTRFFRPEFFNRLDAVVTFRGLDSAEVAAIARKELADLGAREGLAEAGLRLAWSERLVARLAREGYDHRFGARPLQRTIELLVVTPLARWKVAHPQVRDAELFLDLDPDAPGGLGIRATDAGRPNRPEIRGQ